MKTFTGIAEIAAAVGTELGTSDWVTIDQGRIDAFADATGDHQWIHVDAERAKAGPFGTTIAHGFLTLSLLPSFFAQIYRVEGIAMGINYGLGKARFPSPVRVGSRLRATSRLDGRHGCPGRGAMRARDRDRDRGRAQAGLRRRVDLALHRLRAFDDYFSCSTPSALPSGSMIQADHTLPWSAIPSTVLSSSVS